MGQQDKKQQQPQNTQSAESTTVLETTGTTVQDAPRPDLAPAPAAPVIEQVVTAALSGVNAEEQHELVLMAQLLEEYATNSGMHVDLNSSKSKIAFSKLHHAFRLLFKLRGEAFKQGFSIMVKSVVDAKTKAYHPKVVNYHLDNLSNDEQSAFIVFINLVTRFARFDNKAKFAKNTNVSRLTELVSDPELKGLLDEVFLVKQ